jgi:hypothetical protein
LCGDGFRAYESKPRPNCPVSIVNGRCAGGVRSPGAGAKAQADGSCLGAALPG